MFFFKKTKGFTLVEVLVGAAVFLVISVAIYQAYSSLFKLTSANQYKILALNLANEQFEIVRNLSYADVGEVGGIPVGKVPSVQNLVRGGVPFKLTTTIRNIDMPFDGTIGGEPNDLSPADNKLIEVQVDCSACQNFKPITLTTTIAPKNLETASTNGALFIKVFDANGIAVPGATVRVVNTTVNPNIVVEDETDVNGMLQIVDVPPGLQAYSISVSKSGYSSARTYPPGGTVHGYLNPTPTQPDATVVIQQVTQVSFAIDLVSTLSFSSVTPTCSAVPALDFTLAGSKTAGFGIPQFITNLVTNSIGEYSSSTMEWDSYGITNLDSEYDIIGINPLNLVSVNPNSTEQVKLIVAPKSPKTLLVTVKDSATKLPLSGATVNVQGPSSYSETKVTDRGFINQTDWSGGAEQENYVNLTQYFLDDGGVEVYSPTGEIKLRDIFGSYAPAGSLESSTIDTGSESHFHNIIWTPTDQPLSTGADSVKFQFATNNELTATTTWNYVGPDGTDDTYYTLSNSVISSVHDNARYARYKVFLSTDSPSATPNVSDVAFTFTSECTPPGQASFSGLSAGAYEVQVSKDGYTAGQVQVIMPSAGDWVEQQILLAP